MRSEALIVVAHPDDESIFFAGLILSRPKTSWSVICVTDGNADGHGQSRWERFGQACRELGVDNYRCLKFPDKFEQRLPVDELAAELSEVHGQEVFTHGILGEYGHYHHQDVSYACHKVYSQECPLYSLAYNCYPDLTVSLSLDQWHKKAQIFSEIYFSETHRFIKFLPVSFQENFARVAEEEAKAIYLHLTNQRPATKGDLIKYKAMYKYLDQYKINRIRIF